MLKIKILFHNILAGWYLMLISAISDLNNGIAPRLTAFHSSDGAGNTGVTYWKKTYLDMDYCEAQNGYVCQRPAAAGSDSFNKGFIVLFITYNGLFQISKYFC